MGDLTASWSNELRIERFGYKNKHTYYQYEVQVQKDFVKLYSLEYIVCWKIRLQLPSIYVSRPYAASGQMDTLPLHTIFYIKFGSNELAFICTVR